MENRDPSRPNPYAAPVARVEDPNAAGGQGSFSPDGETVPAGNGLRWIADGFDIYRRYPLLWIGISLAFMFISLVVQIIPLLGWLAGAVLGPVWLAGIMIGCDAVAESDELRFSHLFAGFSANAGRLMLFGLANLGMLLGISIVVAALSFALLGHGFSAGTVPSVSGVLFIVLVILALATPYMMAVWFGPALIALSDQGIGDALRGSFLACAKNWLPGLVYSLVLFVALIVVLLLIGALGGFAVFGLLRGGTPMRGMMAGMGLGLFMMLIFAGVLLPLFFASVYASYRDIFYRP
jgi:hypothetical protein